MAFALAYKSRISDSIPAVVLRNTALIDIIFIRRNVVEALESHRSWKGFEGIQVCRQIISFS